MDNTRAEALGAAIGKAIDAVFSEFGIKRTGRPTVIFEENGKGRIAVRFVTETESGATKAEIDAWIENCGFFALSKDWLNQKFSEPSNDGTQRTFQIIGFRPGSQRPVLLKSLADGKIYTADTEYIRRKMEAQF